jgi:DNA-binding response OmpR family regulator
MSDYVRRILIVDPNHESAQALAMLLRFTGSEVDIAHDGVEALQRFAFFPSDVVILDLRIPRSNPFDLCRALKRRRPSNPPFIVAMTRHRRAKEELKSKEAGFDAYLQKPVQPNELALIIEGVFSRQDTDPRQEDRFWKDEDRVG